MRTALITSALLGVVALPEAQAGLVTPVATDLNNPRGLAFGPNGNLYVAEAGLGAGDEQGGFGKGIGFTSSITEIRNVASSNPTQRRVVTGLASLGGTEHGFPEVVGADGISVHGEGGIYVVMAESSAGVLAEDSTLDPAAAVAAQFGKLLKVTPSGQWKATADVGNFDYAWTEAHKYDYWAPLDQFPDANPYGVLALPGRQYVVDAGANTLNEVHPNGSIRIVAYFPNPPVSDAVPTCVANGPDGLLYVGTLGAFVPGQAKVYRVDPTVPGIQFLTEAEAWAGNAGNPIDPNKVLQAITGCGFGPGGFYVTEFIAGDVKRIAINPNGTAGTITRLGVGALLLPNGFAAGPDGSIYVSNFSTSSGDGQVVRVNN